jgi:hypothetical protein
MAKVVCVLYDDPREASFWLDLLQGWIFWTLDRRPSNHRRNLPLVDANRTKRPKADIPPALTNVCFRADCVAKVGGMGPVRNNRIQEGRCLNQSCVVR